ncbi:unnamed protein product [Phytomonas sp. Hart1]|nr:unnamed protein product [Phytomonas sp. Hart1]|eukprot:CCW65984.1 unnamed protein product [Phytomonas sp. isolate Hart1]
MLDLASGLGSSLKREARDRLHDWVREMEKAKESGGCADKRLIVRMNSPEFDPAAAMLDLEMVGILGGGIEGVAIPKVTTRTYDLIHNYVHPDHKLWAVFELPLSLLQAPTICLSGKYACAVIGYDGLAAGLRLPSRMVGNAGRVGPGASDCPEGRQAGHFLGQSSPLMLAANHVLWSARAANMSVIDGVFHDPTDTRGFRQDLQRCQALGLDGKCVIHPDQIAPTHQSFIPNPAEVAWAVQVKAEVERSADDANPLEEMLSEGLHARRADRVLELHKMAEGERQEGEAAASPAAEPSSTSFFREDLDSSTSDNFNTIRRKSRRGKPAGHGSFP